MIKQILTAASLITFILLYPLYYSNVEKMVEALKIRSCTTDEVPRGVDARVVSGTISVWVATYSS